MRSRTKRHSTVFNLTAAIKMFGWWGWGVNKKNKKNLIRGLNNTLWGEIFRFEITAQRLLGSFNERDKRTAAAGKLKFCYCVQAHRGKWAVLCPAQLWAGGGGRISVHGCVASLSSAVYSEVLQTTTTFRMGQVKIQNEHNNQSNIYAFKTYKATNKGIAH